MGTTDPESIIFTNESSGKISYPLAYLFPQERKERERSRPKALEWEHWHQDPWVSNSDNSHKGNHLNTRPSTPQPTVVPYTRCLIETTTTTKYKPNHQQTGLLSHSALPIRGKTNKQKRNLPQISVYTKLTQNTEPNLGWQKPKGRNNSNLKPRKRRP